MGVLIKGRRLTWACAPVVGRPARSGPGISASVARGRRSWRAGPTGQRQRALAEAAEAGADRWARGHLLASARGERGLARAALVGAGRWQAERGWRVGPRKGGAGAGRAVGAGRPSGEKATRAAECGPQGRELGRRGERLGRQGFDLGRDLGLSWVLGFAFSVSFSFSKTKQNLFEFKQSSNSTTLDTQAEINASA